MEDISLILIIAVLTGLVGLLCLGLAITALARVGKAPATAGGDAGAETKAELKSFAFKQCLSAVVMFALAAVILFYS
jgi:hypothetical protein